LIEGIDLVESKGKTLHIAGIILEITGETKPCERMEEQHVGLLEALKPEWRGGVTCKVIKGGRLRIGDPVSLLVGESRVG